MTSSYLTLQVNGVVGGAALLFQQLEVVSLRRVAELRDDALASLAFSCGHHLQVSIPPTLYVHYNKHQKEAPKEHRVLLQKCRCGRALQCLLAP